MDQKTKGKYIGWVGAVAVHALFIIFLLMAGFTIPKPEEEEGMPVMLGDAMDAGGWGDASLTEVDVLPQEAADVPEMASPDQAVDNPLITQDDEETVAMKKPDKPKPETKKVEAAKTDASKDAEAKAKAAAEAEAKAAAEAKRKAAEEAARRKAAEEAAAKRVAGAFGRGAQMGKGNGADEGRQGAPNGNAPTGGGNGGYGSFDLGGRSLGQGGLPRPVYNVQEEGRVVVTITVNPKGQVIATSINRQTNTVSTALRKAAMDAARKARFNEVSGVDNQTGTITYHFQLK